MLYRLALALLAAGCHDLFDPVFPFVCEPVRAVAAPARLSETGLYAAGSTGALGDGVLAYRPRFELWSDGADKQRWLRLPPGAPIDTSNPDDWRFPIGTQIWKQFSRGGVRVETRLIAKRGPGDADWAAIAYRWDGDDAFAVPAGFVDANGTPHDIPAAGECVACHGGRRSFALGVSAVQLAAPAADDEVAITELGVMGLLSAPVPERIALPGDARAAAALGYLHANCGHCHSEDAAAKPCFVPDNSLAFWLPVDKLAAVADTPTYRSAVDVVITPGDRNSALLARMASRDDIFSRMPPLGTREVDAEGLASVRAWVEALGEQTNEATR